MMELHEKFLEKFLDKFLCNSWMIFLEIYYEKLVRKFLLNYCRKKTTEKFQNGILNKVGKENVREILDKILKWFLRKCISVISGDLSEGNSVWISASIPVGIPAGISARNHAWIIRRTFKKFLEESLKIFWR